jgi:hypothetical protein
VKKAISVRAKKKATPATAAKAKVAPRKRILPKKKKPAKSAERRKVEKDLDSMDIAESDEDEEQQTKQKAEVLDDLSQRTKRGAKKGGELTNLQTSMQTHMQEIIELVVGRIQVDPARLKPPPPQFAARVLYQDHLLKLHRHFLTGGTFVAQKDFIVFMSEVMNLNLNSFDI